MLTIDMIMPSVESDELFSIEDLLKVLNECPIERKS
jgi:hypothetical protein